MWHCPPGQDRPGWVLGVPLAGPHPSPIPPRDWGPSCLTAGPLEQESSATSIPPWTPIPRAEPPAVLPTRLGTAEPHSLLPPFPWDRKTSSPHRGDCGPRDTQNRWPSPTTATSASPSCLGASRYRGSAHPNHEGTPVPLSYRCLSDPATFHGRAMTPPGASTGGWGRRGARSPNRPRCQPCPGRVREASGRTRSSTTTGFVLG